LLDQELSLIRNDKLEGVPADTEAALHEALTPDLLRFVDSATKVLLSAPQQEDLARSRAAARQQIQSVLQARPQLSKLLEEATTRAEANVPAKLKDSRARLAVKWK